MRPLLLCVLALALCACSVLREASDEIDDSESLVDQAQTDLESASAPARSSFYVDPQALWLGGSAVRSPQGDPLPQVFRKSFALTVASGPPGEPSKRRLLSQVSELLGFPIEVDPVTLRLAREASAESSGRLSAPPAPPDPSAPPGAGPVALPDAPPPQPPDLSDLDIASGGYLEGSLSDDFVFAGSGISLARRLASALGFLLLGVRGQDHLARAPRAARASPARVVPRLRRSSRRGARVVAARVRVVHGGRDAHPRRGPRHRAFPR